MLEVLTPGACICDLIWKYSLCIYNQIKMRLFWIKVIDQPVRDRNNPIQSLRVMCGEGVKPKGLGGRNNV